MDGGAVYDREIFSILKEAATENGIPWQTKTMIAGGTDGSAIQKSNSGVKTAGIACGLRNIHSPCCVGYIGDFEDMLKVCRLFLDKIGDKLV